MTKIIFAVIDNHNKGKRTGYDHIFKTTDYEKYQKYLKEKGLIKNE